MSYKGTYQNPALSNPELFSRWMNTRWLPISLFPEGSYICSMLILPTTLGQIIRTLSNSSNIVAYHHAWGRELGWDNPFEHYFKLSTLCIHSFCAYAWQWATAIFQLLPTFFNQCRHLSNFATLAISVSLLAAPATWICLILQSARLAPC